MANCTRLERAQCQHGAYCETFSVHDDPNECWKLKQQLPQKPMTNADRIRAMTDEELEAFLIDVDLDKAGSPFITEWGKWLKQPAEGDA